MKRIVALLLVLSLLVFGLATTANAFILFGEDGPGVAGGDVADEAQDGGVDDEDIAEEATPDLDEDEAPAESGGWMKVM